MVIKKFCFNLQYMKNKIYFGIIIGNIYFIKESKGKENEIRDEIKFFIYLC